MYRKGPSDATHTILFHHGAGYTAATWNGVFDAIKQYHCIAFDARSHGDSSKGSVHIDDLMQDCLQLIKHYGLTSNLVLVGHSLGGAVLTRVSLVLHCPLVVIDAMEDVASASLRNIRSFLNARPDSFNCMDDAIRYAHPRTEAARISLLDQLDEGLRWKCDLSSMQPSWSTWFTNHNANFLQVKNFKMLVLSQGIELDRDLLIAQMQGKFRLERVSSSHMIQEEQPEHIAALITAFIK